jgi:hypothetical protein
MSTAKFNTWLNPDGTENYKCRAWVNFNGTGTVAIRAAGNVSSITDNGTGDYTVNFTVALPDGNYSISGSAAAATTLDAGQYNRNISLCSQTFATTSFRIRTELANTAVIEDCAIVNVSVFR